MAIFSKIKQLKKSVKITSGIVIGFALLITIFLLCYQNKWYPNTSINGINVSGMNYEDSIMKLEEAINEYSLKIIGEGEHELIITGKDIDLTANFKNNFKSNYDSHLDNRNIFGLLGGYHYDIDLNISYSEDKLNQVISNSVFITGSDSYQIVKSTNAYIEYDETTNSGKQVKATTGNELDFDKFKNLIITSINKLNNNIDLTDKDQYLDVFVPPVANISDKKLNDMLNTYNMYLFNWISFDMGEGVIEKITPNEIKNWLSCNNDAVVLDVESMKEWIDAFCKKYKTVGKTRNFTTHNGNVIKIGGGDYGWRLDYTKIVEQVEATIKEPTDTKLIEAYINNPNKTNQAALTTKIEPTYSHKGYKKDYKDFENDWDTKNYSEIDLTEQKVYVYRDGQLAYSCICVSGLPTAKNDRITRTGVWFIKEKKTEKVLVGDDYETPVKYWIRIMWTGTGYHALNRSDWDKWTPELYKTKGSHGCLNLQEADAQKLYELIKINDPVFIHY